jgi:chromate reductase
MNICILSGSARSNNNTIRVAYAIRHLIKTPHEVTLIDFKDYDIPLINQGDISIQHLSPFQQQLFDAMSKAHLSILISPEYNYSTTPEILNMLHRFGDNNFKNLFDNCVFALVGVSTGKGGKTPALHLTTIINKIISFLNLNAFVSPKIFESHFTKEVLDEAGKSKGNAMYDKGISDFISYSLNMAEKWQKTQI